MLCPLKVLAKLGGIWAVLMVFGCSAQGKAPREQEEDGGESDDDAATHETGDSGIDGGEDWTADLPCSGFDILWVIDNSPNPVGHFDTFYSNAGLFIDLWDAAAARINSRATWRLGMTRHSATMNNIDQCYYREGDPECHCHYVDISVSGGDGILHAGVGCAEGDPRWKEGPDPEMAEWISCQLFDFELTSIEESSQGAFLATERAFAAAVRPGEPNYGFSLPDGKRMLVVMYLMNGEDMSIADGGRVCYTAVYGVVIPEKSEGMYPISRVHEVLADAAGGEGRYAVMASFGQGGCPKGECGIAYDSPRLAELAYSLGPLGQTTDLCHCENFPQDLTTFVHNVSDACAELNAGTTR
jgi:hypothetical protein